MLVVEKARHIEVELKGKGTEAVVAILQREWPELSISDDDEYENVRESDWFTEQLKALAPGIALKAYRENAGLTQAELSKLTGIPVPHLSGMEHDKRPIGKVNARRLASALHCDYRRFL